MNNIKCRPEALVIADALELLDTGMCSPRDGAAELRRQHSETERLTVELDSAIEARRAAQLRQEQLTAEIVRLEPMRKRAEDLERMTSERGALRAATTELIACLIDARDDVAAELQRCREAAGYPSTDRRLAAQEALLERVDAAIAAAEDQPPAQPVKRLTDEQVSEIEGWFSNEFGLEAKHSTDFARTIETECAAAWGVKLDGEPLPMEHYRAVCAGAVRPTQPGATPGGLRCALIHSA